MEIGEVLFLEQFWRIQTQATPGSESRRNTEHRQAGSKLIPSSLHTRATGATNLVDHRTQAPLLVKRVYPGSQHNAGPISKLPKDPLVCYHVIRQAIANQSWPTTDKISVSRQEMQ